MCVVPDGDLFAAVSAGRASIATDEVQTFTERGLALRSGAELEADVIVTATGLRMLALGGIGLTVDGAPVHLPDQVVYRGMMLSGVPNFAFTVGYTNASWTLKADLTAAYVCRLLNHMRRHGYASCTPSAHNPDLVREPLINLTSGYVRRSVQDFPSQGSRRPWRVRQNYALDMLDFKVGGVDDGVMRFDRNGADPDAGAAASPSAEADSAGQPALSG
jgi:cation diffusion facilitator CzcD-associated flavoprotein CzcO